MTNLEYYKESIELLKDYFKTEVMKVCWWMMAYNPLLCEKPINMVKVGRSEKLYKFIKSRRDNEF